MEAGIRTYLVCGPSTAIRIGNGDAVAKTDRPVRMEARNNDSSRDASSVGVAAEVAVVPARHAAATSSATWWVGNGDDEDIRLWRQMEMRFWIVEVGTYFVFFCNRKFKIKQMAKCGLCPLGWYHTLRSVSSLNNPQNSEMFFLWKYDIDIVKIIIIIIGYTPNNFTAHVTIFMLTCALLSLLSP